MQFNKTFPQRPNNESDAAWSDLFPEKLGFVQHPKLAQNVAGIAVFHELHCLVSVLVSQSRRFHVANDLSEYAATSILGFCRWEAGRDG